MSVDYTGGVVGRDPVAQTVVQAMAARYPSSTDQEIADRINRQYEEPVIDAAEVAHWRQEVPE
ncbi:hypothetical protein [Actinoplanes rectilineatus]|uniref:hypothetical protein n=1 Tax=Actinoplanes rectilineatus TaxID=113571 RepID=UPI0005F2D0C0|nr:hypothetical protein [Actinoplanes rectilineatus]